MYSMSSSEALAQFMTNPHVYLKPPMLCSEMKNHAYIKIIKIILWFILDLIRCNVQLSLHIEDSSMFSGVGLNRRDIGAMQYSIQCVVWIQVIS